jgi:hypothetical protein
MGSIGAVFNQLRILAADGKDAGGAGAEDEVITRKDLEEMTHEAAGGRPVSGVKGKLAAAGLGVRVVPGDIKVIQQAAKAVGHVGSILIDIAGDKELDGHGGIDSLG